MSYAGSGLPFGCVALATLLVCGGCGTKAGTIVRDFDRKYYREISRGIADVVDATDRAFGEPRVEDRERIVQLRIGAGVEFREGDDADPRLRLRVRFPLPALERRANLFLQVESTSDEILEESETTASASLLARPKERLSPGINAGVEWDDGPQPFLRPFLRYERQADPWRIFAEQQVFVKTDDGVGGKTLGHLDRLLDERSFVRLRSSVGYNEELDGADVTIAAVYRRPFVPESILSFETGVEFNTADDFSGDIGENQVFTQVRWRGKVLRRWLEYEIRPAVFFPFEGESDVELGILFGLAVVFEDYLRPREVQEVETVPSEERAQ